MAPSSLTDNHPLDSIDICSISLFRSICNVEAILSEKQLQAPMLKSQSIILSSCGYKILASIGFGLLLKLLDDLKPSVMLKEGDNSQGVLSVSDLIREILKGFENENSMDSQEHSENIHDMILEICRKNLKERLGEYPVKNLLSMEQILGDDSAEGKALGSFIGTFYNVNLANFKPIDNQEKVLAVGLKIILEYVLGEIIELSMNYTRDCKSFAIGPYAIQQSINFDDELKNSLPTEICSALNLQLLIVKNWFNIHTDSSEVSIREGTVLSTLPTDVHLNILKFVGNYNELLNMRRVCKYWNSLIVENDEIWKYCYHLTMIKDPLFFTYATSSTLSKLRNDESKGWKLKFFSELNPHLSLKKSIVSSFMKQGPTIDARHEEIYNNAISLSYNFYADYFRSNQANQNDTPKTKIGGVPNTTNKAAIWRKGYVFVGQLDCSEIGSLINYQLPKSGFLYFFAKVDNIRSAHGKPLFDNVDGYVVYQDYQDNSTVPQAQKEDDDMSVVVIHNYIIKLGISIDTRAFIVRGQEEDAAFSFYRGTTFTQEYDSHLFGQYSGVFTNNFKSEENEIVLLSALAFYPNTQFRSHFVYSISRDSLAKGDFHATRLSFIPPQFTN